MAFPISYAPCRRRIPGADPRAAGRAAGVRGREAGPPSSSRLAGLSRPSPLPPERPPPASRISGVISTPSASAAFPAASTRCWGRLPWMAAANRGRAQDGVTAGFGPPATPWPSAAMKKKTKGLPSGGPGSVGPTSRPARAQPVAGATIGRPSRNRPGRPPGRPPFDNRSAGRSAGTSGRSVCRSRGRGRGRSDPGGVIVILVPAR